MKSNSGTLSVNKQFKRASGGGVRAVWEEQSADDSVQEVICVSGFPDGVVPATVGVTMGLTINMGNYEFAKIDVTCSVPCMREEMGEAHSWVSSFAEERLQKEVDEIRALAGKK